MKAPFGRLAVPALLTTILVSLTSFAQTSRPSLAQMRQGYKPLPSAGLLECGSSYYKATLISTGFGLEVLAKFENAQANAVCGNAVLDSEKFNKGYTLGTSTLSFHNLSSVESYDNGSVLNISAYFNPGLRRVLRKGRTELLACHQQLGQAEIIDLQNTGLVSLKFRDQSLDQKCGQGRYHLIEKLLKATLALQKTPSQPKPLYSEAGYMECGPNYYAARVEHSSASNNVVVHFINDDAQSVCGHANYDAKEITEGRGLMATQWAKFLERPKSEPSSASILNFLNENRLVRGQVLSHVACKNNLGKAQVINVNKEYGLVTFHFENPQLDALCGQGRYHLTSKVIKASEALMKRLPHVQVFSK